MLRGLPWESDAARSSCDGCPRSSSSRPAATDVTYLGLAFPGIEGYDVFVEVGATKAELVEQYRNLGGAITRRAHPFALPPLATWVRFELQLSHQTTWRASLAVDGMPLVSVDAFETIMNDPSGISASVGLGCVSGQSPMRQLWIDNVSVDVK